MVTEQLLLDLPEDLVRRFEREVPAGARSSFVQHLLEQALPTHEADDDALYRIALEVERDETLAAEMAEWDVTVGDGLEPANPLHEK